MPWVSRKDLDHLYTIIEKLTDHRARVERVEAGLTETPAPPRVLLPPMPPEVLEWIRSHDGKAIQERLRKEAFSAAKQAGSWDGVVNDIQAQAFKEGG